MECKTPSASERVVETEDDESETVTPRPSRPSTPQAHSTSSTAESTSNPAVSSSESAVASSSKPEAAKVRKFGGVPLVPRNSFFWRRITRDHIEPFPPLQGQYGRRYVPLVAFILPFTEQDARAYNRRHKLIKNPDGPGQIGIAVFHLMRRLPIPYCRWANIEDQPFRGVVLATNASKEELEYGFDLEMMEKIRRFMGVPWIPTWEIPAKIRWPIFRPPSRLDESLVVWGENEADCRGLSPLRWDIIRQCKPDDFHRVEYLIIVRSAMFTVCGQVKDRFPDRDNVAPEDDIYWFPILCPDGPLRYPE